MSRIRMASVAIASALLVAPLLAGPPAPSAYRVVGTLPDTVGGQALGTLIFDRQAHRLYAGSREGLYWSDLGVDPLQWHGPFVRKFIGKVEAAPDLGRVFYAAVDEIGYMDADGSAGTKIASGTASDLVYEPTRHEIYATFAQTAVVQVFDARTGKLNATIALPGWNGTQLEAIPGRVFLFVGGKDGLYSIGAADRTLAPWPVEGHFVTPGMLRADPSGRYLFSAYSREIDAVDLATHKVIGHVDLPTMASIAFDPGTRLLLASWWDELSSNHHYLRAYRATPDGLTEVGDVGDPETGRVGLEQTDCGFIQTAFHELLVWGCR